MPFVGDLGAATGTVVVKDMVTSHAPMVLSKFNLNNHQKGSFLLHVLGYFTSPG